ncbi:MAG: lytic transglycosylase domain-containing protein [Eikenella corrodens]|nr:lytic transglycosylase domain-containing protein [Eikenella corrodens]
MKNYSDQTFKNPFLFTKPSYIWFALLLLFISYPALSDGVSNCLKGFSNTPDCRRMIANYWQHAPAIERIARQEGVEPELLKALIAYESRYNHQAVSPAQASGLTQVMPTTALGMHVHPSSLFIPEVSIRTGARYLRQMYNQFGRLDLALAAYNAGPRRVSRAGNRVPRIAETQHYVRNVTALYVEFKRKAASSAANHVIPHVSANLRVAQVGKPRYSQTKSETGSSVYQSHTSNIY